MKKRSNRNESGIRENPVARLYFALLLTAATLLSAGCGSGATNVTLGQLAESQQTYVGQQVQTRGIVRHEQNPDGTPYFVLADPHGMLVGLEPAGAARRFEGRLVQVSGLFEVQPGFGRVIHITSIAPAKDDSG